MHGLFQRVCFFSLTSSWTVFANPTSAVFYYCMSERIFSFSGLEHFRCTSQFSFLWMNSNVLFTCSIFSLFVVVWIVLLGRWVFVYFFFLFWLLYTNHPGQCWYFFFFSFIYVAVLATVVTMIMVVLQCLVSISSCAFLCVVFQRGRQKGRWWMNTC